MEEKNILGLSLFILLFICWSIRVGDLFATTIAPCIPKDDITASAIYVSQFTVETYCFADGRCLFKQPNRAIQKQYKSNYEIKFLSTVSNLQYIDCAHNSAN